MKKTLVYVIAAIVAIGVAFALFTMFRSQTEEQQMPAAAELTAAVEPVEMIEVVMTNQQIPAGVEINHAMIKTSYIPVTEKPFFALENAHEVIGMLACEPIESGTIILSSMVEQPHKYIADSQGLSYEIPEGFVGLAIPAARLEGVAGYLLPGDVINILADAKSVKAAMNGVPYIEGDVLPITQAYLVKNVTVLAVGDKAYDEMSAAGALERREAEAKASARDDGEDSQGGTTYDCVIIALDDFSAQLVVETMQTSKLTFTLKHRSYGVKDVTVPELVPVPQDFTYLTENEYRNK